MRHHDALPIATLTGNQVETGREYVGQALVEGLPTDRAQGLLHVFCEDMRVTSHHLILSVATGKLCY